ncbi:hypothetical protein N7523_008757 [Penicillium sp. IBT 18751x]|nr:hypothetical protein N7523_008757 [Penicillium sp. IBT 18751x]
MVNSQQWYFAYGSNMLSDVFITRRKIKPLRSEVARIETHSLSFNIMGVPYTDPAMGGLRMAEKQDLPAYGVAYLLSPDDMKRVIVSEGGGIAYKTEVFRATLQRDGSEVNVTALMGRHRIPRSYERLPSTRYMDLLIRGASEHALPDLYQKRLLSQLGFGEEVMD